MAPISVLNQWAERWLEWMLPMAWQVAILVAAVWAVSLVTRRASPRFRYALWCLVLIKLCLPPNLSVVTGIGQWLPGHAGPSSTIDTGISASGPRLASVPVHPAHEGSPLLARRPARSARAASATRTGTLPHSRPSPRPTRDPLGWPVVAFGAWFLGVLVMTCLLALAYLRVRRRLAASCIVDDPRALSVFERAFLALGVRRPTALLAAEDTESPILLGLWRPRVVLPSSALDMPAEQLGPIFLHELAHLRRGDLWVNWLQAILQTLYWFHPLVWFVNWRLRRERELIVDDAVLSHLDGPRSDYSSSLLNVVKQAARARLLAPGYVGIVETPGSIAHRIRRILDAKRRLSLKLGWVSVAVLTALGLVLIPQARSAPAPAKKTGKAPSASAQGDQPSPVRPAAAARKTLADIKPPFTFRIHTLTPDGKPQPGVKIRCRHPRRGRGATIVDRVVESDAHGVAAFHVTDADLVRDRFFWFGLAGRAFMGSSTGVSISPVDEEFECTFRVLPARRFRIRVVDTDGWAVPGARLSLWADHPKFPTVEAGAFRASAGATTNAEGLASARFPKVKANVVASGKGYAARLVRGIDLPTEEPFRVRLLVGYTIRGRVTDDQGQPVPEAKITAKKKDFVLSYMKQFILKATTDEDGRFKLHHASEGTYEIQCHAEGEAAPLFMAPVTVQVGAHAPEPRVEITGKLGAVLMGQYVTPHKFRPALRSILVSTFAPKRMHWKAEAAEDGSFTISGIPPNTRGSISFVGVSGHHQVIKLSRPEPFFQIDRRRIKFDNVPPGMYDGIEVRFLVSGRATGLIRDPSGKPVPGVEVVVRPQGSIYKTSRTGRYSASIAPEREVTLNVRAPSTHEVVFESQPFRVREGEVVEKNLTLPKRFAHLAQRKHDRELTGRVLDTKGDPVPEAIVHFGNTVLIPPDVRSGARPDGDSRPRPTWQGGFSFPARVTSDAEGRFRFNLLFPGKSDVWAEHPRLGWGWVSGVSTSATDVEIRLKPQPKELTFRGSVVDADGKPAVGAWLGLFTHEQELTAEATTDARGRFTLRATPPWHQMRYLNLLCVPNAKPIAWKTLPWCSGDDVEVRLREPAAVSGRVVNARGAGIQGAQVRLHIVNDDAYGRLPLNRGPMEHEPVAETDGQGKFRLANVPLGSTVSLRVDHPDYAHEYAWSKMMGSAEAVVPAIKLADGAAVEGTVRYAGTGKPAAGAVVRRQTFSHYDPKVTTDAQGRYRLRGQKEAPREWADVLTVEAGGPPAQWRGTRTITERLGNGAHLTGVDIVLRPTIEARQKEWRRRPGEPERSAWRVAVVDDADPAFDGKDRYEDAVTVYDSSSNPPQQWRHVGLNTCQTIGGNHGVVWNASDQSVCVAEQTRGGLLKLTRDGQVIWQKTTDPIAGIAADPKTGNCWILTNDGTIYGKGLVVLGPSGEQLHQWKIAGFDLAYSAQDDCFWVAGKKVLKVSRTGELLHESSMEFSWCAVSIDVDAEDGSAWVVEGEHLQVAGSESRLWIFEADGRRRKQVRLENRVSCVAVDARRRCAWLVGNGLLKMTRRGEVAARAPVTGRSVCMEPDTGYVWVGGKEAIYQLDSEGRLIFDKRTPNGSQKWVCMMPRP